MLTAKDASNLTQPLQEKLNKINHLIEIEATNGNYSLMIEEYVSYYIRTYLESLGYYVYYHDRSKKTKIEW